MRRQDDYILLASDCVKFWLLNKHRFRVTIDYYQIYLILHCQQNANLADPHPKIVNGGLGGAPSSYMEVCSKQHIPATSNIIIVEFTLNDEANPNPEMNNLPRRAFERMLRKLLSYPNKPAVIILHVFRWFRLLGVSLLNFFGNIIIDKMQYVANFRQNSINTLHCRILSWHVNVKTTEELLGTSSNMSCSKRLTVKNGTWRRNKAGVPIIISIQIRRNLTTHLALSFASI